MSQPTLYVIAGPNGAGKSSVYQSRVRFITSAEFVNADLLALNHFGKVATTQKESQWGQEAAEARRSELLSLRQSFVMESTFSHPTKLQILHTAKQYGYHLFVLHVSVGTADLAVARVALRVRNNGHPVPEDRVRRRYERNQEIIKAAVLLAKNALILDNSLKLRPPRPVIDFVDGLGTRHPPVPLWAERIYGSIIP